MRNSITKRDTGFSSHFWALWSGACYATIRTALNGKGRDPYKRDEKWRNEVARERGVLVKATFTHNSREEYLFDRYVMDEYKEARRAWISLETERGRSEWNVAYQQSEKRKEYCKKWMREKKHTLPIEGRIMRALRDRVRRRLKKLLLSRKHITTIRAAEAARVKAHIERQFARGMSWKNWGHKADGRGRVWHIDHIIPICKFDITKPQEIARANHWSNLRPMWSEDNLRKGGKLLPNAQPELLATGY